MQFILCGGSFFIYKIPNSKEVILLALTAPKLKNLNKRKERKFMSNLIKCSMCGSLHERENCITVNRNSNQEMYVCNSCIEDRNVLFRCIECEEYYTQNFLWGSFQGDNVCMNCSSEYFVCPSCTEVCHVSERVYYTRSDEEICSSCMEDRCGDISNLIEDYYYKPTPVFYGESEADCYLGVELEVDNTGCDYDGKLIYQAAETLIDDYAELYLKHDGSLSRGFEIVTHPCSLDYHYNRLGWQEIMKICKDGTLYSHDTNTCGLHIHLSRRFFGESQETQDLHISKLLLLISKFYDSHLLKFSRRQPSELRWCSNPSIDYEDDDNEYTIVDKMKQLKFKGRYVAVNLENTNTIEFRLFKGTLNFSTFIASLQFVVEISRYAMRTDLKNIPTTNFRGIFISTEFKELKNYLKEKGLI